MANIREKNDSVNLGEISACLILKSADIQDFILLYGLCLLESMQRENDVFNRCGLWSAVEQVLPILLKSGREFWLLSG